jgi:hypothetical protein
MNVSPSLPRNHTRSVRSELHLVNRYIVSYGRKLISLGRLAGPQLSREADGRKLFGEDDEAGEEGELDKAKAEGENGKLASSHTELTISRGD